MKTSSEKFIVRLLAIPGWREEKPLKRYRVFAFYDANRRILIGTRCAIRSAHKNKLSENMSIGHTEVTQPENLWKKM